MVDEVFFSDVRYFQMFDMSIHSGDIRDQSRKLSEMTPKFGRFRPSKKMYPSFAARGLKNFREGTPTSGEVIVARTLNFRPNFKFS